MHMVNFSLGLAVESATTHAVESSDHNPLRVRLRALKALGYGRAGSRRSSAPSSSSSNT